MVYLAGKVRDPVQETPLKDAADIARRIIDLLADRQAEKISLLDVRGIASFADFFVVASATNPRQMRALVETLDKDLRDDGVKADHREGELDSGWVLLDFGDIIVHLFSPEQREHYALEELWQAGKQVVVIQ